MATLKTKLTQSGKELFVLTMGPKEARALRDVIGNVKAADDAISTAAYWIDGIREQFNEQGVTLLPTKAERRARYNNKAFEFKEGSKHLAA